VYSISLIKKSESAGFSYAYFDKAIMVSLNYADSAAVTTPDVTGAACVGAACLGTG